MANIYEFLEPDPEYWNSIPDHVKDEIYERMDELGLNTIIENYDEIKDQIQSGEVTTEYAALLDMFLFGVPEARRIEATGLWPEFSALLRDYGTLVQQNETEYQEELITNPEGLQDNLLAAFGDGFELATNFLDTQSRVNDALRGTFREDTSPEPALPWELRIGSSRFSVPPINIDVSQSFRVGSLSGGALRQQSAPKFNSGHKETMITMTLYFPTHESIWGVYDESGVTQIDFDNPDTSDAEIDRFLSSLRGLITQFKYAPFLPIRNAYLNGTYGITGVVLHSMSVSTVENYPFATAVQLEMLNFNHKVYLPMIEDFNQAVHWGRYRQYMGRAAKAINSMVGIGFLGEHQGFSEPVAGEDPVDIIGYESEPDDIFRSPLDDFVKNDRRSWSDGRHLDIYYPLRTPGRVFAPDMANFRQPGEDVRYGDKDRNAWETFIGYLGLTVDTNPEAVYDKVTTYSSEITARPKEREKLLEYLNWITNAADTMNADALRDYLQRRYTEEKRALGLTDDQDLPADVKKTIDEDVKIEWFRYIFEGYKETPFFQAYLKNADYNTGNYTIQEWEVPMDILNIDRNNVIVNGVSVSMANNIARLQVQMQEEPTHQHIGGRETRVDVSMTVFDETDLARFQRLFQHINGLAQLEHAHGVLGFLGIKNAITALCGIKYVLPYSFEIDTIPGYPHIYNVRMSFVDFDIFQQKREELSSSQQRELVEAFGKRNPFLRIKQLWGAFNAYPDFPLSVRNDAGDVVGHLDPDYFYKSFKMIDDDVVNWDLPPSQNTDQQIGAYPNGTLGLAGQEIKSIQETQWVDENSEPVSRPVYAASAAEGANEYWTATENFPSGYNVDYEATGGRFEDALKKANYVHGINHYLGLFNESQDEVSIVRIEKDGLMLGSQKVPDEETRSGVAKWLTTGAPSDEGGNPVKYQLHEDVAAQVHNQPFVPFNTPTNAYMQPHADASTNPYKQFELMMRDTQYRDISGRMIRAFPTYMLWLIDEGGNFAGVKLFDNFYGLQSVIDMSIHQSEDILGDTLVLRLSNLYQKLTTPYKGMLSSGDGATQLIDMFLDRQRNIASGISDTMVDLETIRLRPGIRVHLRMGYSANPNALETVFNGTITEVKQGDIVEVIAQSDAIELSPYINTTNKNGHSGDIDGAFNTGLWLSEPRDLMVRLLSMGSSTFKEAAAFATQGMIFSENRFGIRHFGTILYPPLTDEEDQKNRNIRDVVGNLLNQAGSANSVDDAAVAAEDAAVEAIGVPGVFNDGEAFDAQLGGIGVRSPVIGVIQQMWQNMFAQRDYEIFKRNIYPGNGLGVAQYLGGDLLDGGVIWAEVSGAEPGALELAQSNASGNSSGQRQNEQALAIADQETNSDDDTEGSDEKGNASVRDVYSNADDQLGQAFSDTVVSSFGGPIGSLASIWGNPVNPFSPSTNIDFAASLFGQGPYKNHPLLQMFNLAGYDEDLTGFDEVSFRAQTYMKSVWDLFQLCAALLPNYIVAVRPFEDRSTVFYGKPHWLYTSGVVPVTTGIPKADELQTDSIFTELVDLQVKAANAANPLADLENQLKFFQGLGEKTDPAESTAGLEFTATLEDVNQLSLEHPNGAKVPYRSGPVLMGKHLETAAGTSHKEVADLNPEYSYAEGYVYEGTSDFGALEPELEQFYIKMRWPYADWSKIGTDKGEIPNSKDTYITGQNVDMYKNLRIIAYAPSTGLACVCVPAGGGPGSDRSRVAEISPDVAHVLGVSTDAELTFGLVPDGTQPGPATELQIGDLGTTDNSVDNSVRSESGQNVSVSIKDISEVQSIEYVEPISDRDIKDTKFWFDVKGGQDPLKKWQDSLDDLGGSKLNGEQRFYRRLLDNDDFDLKEEELEKAPKNARSFAYDYGWLIDEIPVWIDPQTGGEEHGTVVADHTGITARRIYDPDYNKLYDGEDAGPLQVFENQNTRTLDEAESIWDTIRKDFPDAGWVREDYESWVTEVNGRTEYTEQEFYQAMQEWLQFLWQDPVRRAWVVLTADRQSDWTSSSVLGLDVDLNTEFDFNVFDGDGISLGPHLSFGGSGNEGWDLNSSPFRNMWQYFLVTRNDSGSWEDDMWQLMRESFEPGNTSQTIEEQLLDAAESLYDATIGKLITAAATTMTGLVALFRLGLQQLGQGMTMLSDMQRQANILNRVFNDSIYYAAGEPGQLLRLVDNPFTREYGEPVVEVREPFQRMHYISSFQHILSNNVTETLSDVATVVTASSDGKYPVTVYFDKGAPSERQVETSVETGLFWDNARGSGFFGFLHPLFHPIETARGVVKSATGSSDEILSKRVGLYHLKENLKDIYDGEILVLGNPEIRPHDLVYLADVYERMYGMFEVEAVTHHFTPELGFVTGITPNALVTINDPARWSVISWAWSWWATKNTRDDLRYILGVKNDKSSQLSDEGVTTPELAAALDTQLRGSVQYTHGGSALVRDLIANRTSGTALSTNEAYESIEAIDVQADQVANALSFIPNPIGYAGVALGWPAWKWVRDNLLDQHGCYIQYLTKNGQPMDAGLSYAQGVVVGRHHSVNLLPGILGLEVDTFSPEGNRRITTNDLLKSLGWQETEVTSIQKDVSWWVNQTNARILDISGHGPDPVGLGDEANVEYVTVGKVDENGDYDGNGIIDGDTIILTDGRRVRLAGINTEELQFKYNLDMNAESDRAYRARQYLERILIDEPQALGHPTTVALRINPTAGVNGRDQYGRILATVFHRVPEGTSAENREAVLRSFAGSKLPDVPRQPFVTWDQFMPDGRPYTANWDLVTAGLADVDLRGITRNDPDRGALPLPQANS